jgi:antitoxin ParD1/3/4
MTITLTPEQQAWIDAHVARGDYASTEDAARRLIDAAIRDATVLETDDLAWAKPLVDEALADVERGAVIPGDVVLAELRAAVERAC